MAESRDRLGESVKRFNLDKYAVRKWFKQFFHDLTTTAMPGLRINGFGTFKQRFQKERFRVTRDQILRFYEARTVVGLSPPSRPNIEVWSIRSIDIHFGVAIKDVSAGIDNEQISLRLSGSHEGFPTLTSIAPGWKNLELERSGEGRFVCQVFKEGTDVSEGISFRLSIDTRAGDIGAFNVEPSFIDLTDLTSVRTMNDGNPQYVNFPSIEQMGIADEHFGRVRKAVLSSHLAGMIRAQDELEA